MITVKSKFLRIIGIALVTFIGVGINAATIDVPADYTTIQAAIDAASTGDVINVAAGTYYETLNIQTAGIDIIGASRATVIIDPTGLATNNSGIYVAADNVTLQSFTLQSTVTNLLPRYGIKFGEVDGCTLEDVTAQSAYRSGIDALGTSHLTIYNVSSLDNGGHGLSLVDCNYASVTDITLSGNGWQNVSVATWGRYTTLGTSNIFFNGTNDFGDLFQLEMGDYNNPGVPPAGDAIITYSTNPIDGADVTVQAGDFGYALHGTQDDSPDQVRVWLFSTISNAAMVAAAAPIGHWTGDAMYIENLTDDSELYVTPGCSIQTAIDVASAGDVINVTAGTYYQNSILIDKPLTLLGIPGTCGPDAGSPILDGGGADANGFEIAPGVDDVTIEGFFIRNFGISPTDAGQGCGVWAYGTSADPITNITVRNNQFDGCIWASVFFFNEGQSMFDNIEIDCNTVNVGTWSTDVNVYGIEITNCKNSTVSNNFVSGGFTGILMTAQAHVGAVAVDNNTISNNSVSGSVGWGGNISAVAWGDLGAEIQNILIAQNEIAVNHTDIGNGGFGIRAYPGAGGSFTGDIVINENNFILTDPGYLAIKNQSGISWDASGNYYGSTDPATVAGLVGSEVDFTPWLGGGTSDNPGFSGDFTTLYVDDDSPQTGSTGRIQEGVDLISGSTVYVEAGTYLETLLIDKPVTLLGATAGVNKNGYTVPAGYAWDDATETIIMHPNPAAGYTTIVDIYDTDDVTFDGFIVQELSAVANLNSSLLRVYAFSKVISNISVVNCIIGPNTNTVSQDGTHGRMGLYLVNHPYSDNGITNSTFADNKIFDCKGNGDNIFLWSAYYAYGAPGPASMAGTVIEDNEIYGSHRCGIETAGGFSDLVIRNNEIYDNSELPGDDVGKLKYGHGILLIRGSSDKMSDPLTAFGPVDLTIEGNNIYGNSKNGIYTGPKNEGVTITNNTIYDNGWDGVMVDLLGTYWNPQFEPEPTALQYSCLDCANDVTLFENTIYNNGTASYPGAEYGAHVNGVPTNSFVLDATENYWGTLLCSEVAAGVYGEVEYDPWCNDNFSFCGFTCSLSEAWVDDDWVGYASGDPVDGHIFGHDAFNTIQDAIDAVNGSTVHVAAGTYREQLYIDKDINLLGSGSADCIIEAPDAVDRSTYTITQWTGSARTIDAVIGVYTASMVNIDGFKIDGRDTGPANFYGIHFFDTDGSVTNCIIDNVTYSAVPGTQSIVSLVATHSLGATFTIDIAGNTVPVFQKGGIALMGPGCSFTVNDNNVSGVSSSSIAGNCIQLSYGAHGSTSDNYVEGTAYTGDDWASTGILLFESGDVTMDGDEVYNCESGVNFSDWGWVYSNPTPVNLDFTNLNLHSNEWSLGVQMSRDNSDVNLTVSNSSLLDNGGDGFDLWGTGSSSYYTGWSNGDFTAVITGCTITNSLYDGIWTGDLSGNANNNADIDVHGCYFTGNTSSAVNNTMTQTVDATGCYWDDPTGPTVGSRSRSTRSIAQSISPFGAELSKNVASYTIPYNDSRGSGETVLGPVTYSPFWMANYIGDPHTGPWNWGVDNSGTIGSGYASASSGDIVNVYAGTYTEQVTLTQGKDITFTGESRDVVTWVAPTGGKCLVGDMTGYTGAMNYEVSGFTFNCRADAATTYGVGVMIYRATNGPLTLSIHDNRFTEDRASGDDTHWATSIFACHNRFAERDGFGDAPVLIYNNIDETWGGMTMSNTRAYDIYGNTFDGCSDAIYNGHGCPDSDPTLFFGDHHIYDNIFMNATDDLHSGTTPALDWQYYGAGAGTHLPSVIENNTFEDNDVAVRFVMDTDMMYPAHDVTGNSFINNGMAVIVDGAYASSLDAEENYWDVLSCPGVAATVSGPVDYDPWCNSDFSFCGFSCSLAEVWVDDDWAGTAEGTNVGGHIFGYDAFDVIADGVNAVSNSGIVHVMNGNYDIPINIENRSGISILGESEAGTLFKPASTLAWGFAPYGSARQAAVRVVNSTGVVLTNMTMDFDLVKGDNIMGLLFWNSSGELSNNTFQNMNTAGYYEIMSYLRAPDYTDGARAQIDILNNTFLKTGRVGIVIHDYVNTLIEGNSFDMVVDDFGYAIELGSAATGIIRDNVFSNYDTWAATDQSAVSAIYVENSFTMGVVDPITKSVTIEENEISSCQYGIFVGNEVVGYAGNVDIAVSVEGNTIHDNTAAGSQPSGGIVLTDEGKDAGSSVNATLTDNTIYNNGDYGVQIYTNGNGDITTTMTENILGDNYTGVSIKDYATTSSSSYNMTVHHNFFDNYLNAEDDVAGGYWDDLVTNEGNCWSDWETNTGYPYHYEISGNAGTRDRRPNRANCDGMGDCQTGEANGEAPINILDVVYIINYKYKEGPAPTPYALCSGDPNCDCEVDILDAVYIINFKYKDGPEPCGGSDWMLSCKLPIRGQEITTTEISPEPTKDKMPAESEISNEPIKDTKTTISLSAFK